MGKRELLIAIAFVAVGVVAYQVSAPPATEGRGFSLRQLWNHVRTEIQEDRERTSVTHKETVAVPAGVRELRLIEVPRQLKLIGQERADIEYEFVVESTGPTVEQAREYANRSVLLRDDLGDAVAFRASYPEEGQQRARLVMYVPRALAVRLQSVRDFEASTLASLHIEGAAGDCRIADVAGAVTGTHSSGELSVHDVGSVKLTLVGSDATFARVTGGLQIDARNGEARLSETRGALDITGLNEVVVVVGHAGPVRIGGSGGQVTLDGPSEESRVDMRRAEVEVTLRQAVPLMLLTTDEPLTLRLDAALAVHVDAVATDAGIDASALALTPDASGRDHRLTHLFAPGATARVSLRNLRGDIVIGKLK